MTLIHYYLCDVCGFRYEQNHDSAAVYDDACPACGCADNDVVAIEKEGGPRADED